MTTLIETLGGVEKAKNVWENRPKNANFYCTQTHAYSLYQFDHEISLEELGVELAETNNAQFHGEKVYEAAKLDGDLLNCLMETIINKDEKIFFSETDGYTKRWRTKPKPYSSDWAICGPVMVSTEIFPSRYYGCGANNPNKYMAGQGLAWMRAETPLIATCRAVIAKHFGPSFVANLSQQIGLTKQDIIDYNASI